MTVTETLNEGLKRGFEVLIPGEEIAARVTSAIAELAPQVRMAGFRPGKVPSNLIRRMHGKAVHQEELQKAINETVTSLLEERQLRAANQPEIDLDSGTGEGEDVKFSLALEVLPDVPETEIEGIELERLMSEPTDADLEEALERMAKQARTFEDAPGGHKAADGNLVVMNYAGTVDGEPFEGGTGEDMQIELGSGRLIPGFEDGLLGIAAEEERELKLAFPEDYPAENLKGKDAVFKVKATALKTAKTPAVDDELAKSFGLDSLEKLKEILKDQVEQELNGLTRTYLKRKLLDHLAAGADFPVPPSMVEAELKQILTQAGSEGDISDEERADLGRIAERRVRLGLLLSDMGQKNNVQVSQEEMNRLVAREAARYPGQQQQVYRFFNENAMAAAQLRAPLFEEKVVDFLLGKATITDRVVTRAELEAAIEDEDETPFAAHHHDHHHHHDHDHHHHDHDHDHHAHGEEAAKKPVKAKKAKAETGEDEKAEKKATPKKKAEAAEEKKAEKKAAPKKKAVAEKPTAKDAAKTEAKTARKATPKKKESAPKAD